MENPVENFKLFLLNNHLFSAVIVMVLVFFIVYIITPRVIGVAQKKNLINPIIGRSSHKREVPSLGGVSFFMVFLITIPLINLIHFDGFAGYSIIGAITILFMVGLKDDLVNSSARVKLYGQFLASAFIVFSSDFIITDYRGFLGIGEINPILSMAISFLFLVVFINSFNLIDGLDGLASMVGIVISSAYLVMFTLKEDYFFASLSLVTIATLGSFLRFNLAKGKLKIFMGDCGSLIIGLMIGVMTLHFLTNQPLLPPRQLFLPENRMIFVFSVLFIPLLDTFRVILLRLIAGKSPMEADRNHLHHVLNDYLKSHIKTSLVLAGLNLIVLLVFFSVASIYSFPIVSLVMSITTIIILIVFHRISFSKKYNTFSYEEEEMYSTDNQKNSPAS